ncbi:MAG: hypothetical protein K2L77_04220 [Muribaculaceae bacterium]|nr:hypothetical protein [Muribaculaceae bacterium]
MKHYKIIIKDEADLDRLLDAYYAGETTPVHEDAIAGYFAEIDTVPAKYQADAALFKALDKERRRISEMTVPENLARCIAEATYGRRKYSRLLSYVRWLSVAAALAMFVPVAIKLIRSEPELQPVNNYAASDLRKDSLLPSARIHVAEEIDAENVSDTVSIVVPAASENVVSVAVAGHASDRVQDPYTEIYDSISVTEIMQKVFGKLDNSLAMAGKGMKKKDLALNNINETVNNILSK